MVDDLDLVARRIVDARLVGETIEGEIALALQQLHDRSDRRRPHADGGVHTGLERADGVAESFREAAVDGVGVHGRLTVIGLTRSPRPARRCSAPTTSPASS